MSLLSMYVRLWAQDFIFSNSAAGGELKGISFDPWEYIKHSASSGSSAKRRKPTTNVEESTNARWRALMGFGIPVNFSATVNVLGSTIEIEASTSHGSVGRIFFISVFTPPLEITK